MKTSGFIIGKTDQSEADRVFTVYTRDFGKIKIIAKAVRKISSKLRFNLELFCFNYFDFVQGRNQKIITEVLPERNFARDFKNYPQKLKSALYIARMIDHCVQEDEKDEHIWQLAAHCFRQIHKLGGRADDYAKLLRFFDFRFLKFLGYMPRLHHCVLCGKKITERINFLSPRNGGLICPICLKGSVIANEESDSIIKVDPQTIKILRLLFAKDFDFIRKLKLSRNNLGNLREVFKNLLEYSLEKRMGRVKSFNYLTETRFD